MSKIEKNYIINSWEACGAGLVFLFLKEPAEEAGNLLKDCISECRQCLSEVFEKRRQIREAKKMSTERQREVPSKFIVSWSQGAMLENDDELQRLWATLFVNAEDRDFKGEIRITYIEILKSLNSLDALILHEISVEAKCTAQRISEKIGANGTDIAISIDNLKRLRLVDSMRLAADVQGEKDVLETDGLEDAAISFAAHLVAESEPKLTALGNAFCRACMEL